MSAEKKRARWVLPLVVTVGALLLLALWFGTRTSEVEPRGHTGSRVPRMDAGLGGERVPGDGGSSSEPGSGRTAVNGSDDPFEQSQLHTGRMDGAVQLHLPPAQPPSDMVVLSPDELRGRRSEQISLIEDRIEALTEQINVAPASPQRGLLERRRDHLVERRDTLIGTLLDPSE